MPVPTVQEFIDGKTDLDSIEDFANSTSSTFVRRLTGSAPTITGILELSAQGTITTYSAAATYSNLTDWVDVSGVVYRPIPSQLPIGPEAFNSSKWVVVREGELRRQEGYDLATPVPDAPNLIAGHSLNSIVGDVHSSTISGGGLEDRENCIGYSVAYVNTGTSNLTGGPILATESKFCLIGGGYDNVINGLANVIPVGQHCYIDLPADHGTITGGSVNSIKDGSYNGIYSGTRNTIEVDSGGYSLIAGGGDNEIGGVGSHVFIGAGSLCVSTASEFSVIAGGQQNTLTNATASFIGGGSGNDISLDSCVIVGGNGNDISVTGQGCSIGGGIDNHARAESSCVPGGRSNEALANYTIASGYRAIAERAGQRAWANSYFATKGDAQVNDIILKKIVTSASEVVLEDLSGGSDFTSKVNMAFAYKIMIVGHRTDVQGDNAVIILQGMVSRGASGAHTITKFTDQLVSTAGAATWTARIFDSAGSLRVAVTGEAAKTINWVAEVHWVQSIG